MLLFPNKKRSLLFLSIISIAFIQACGFTPVYKKQDGNDSAISSSLKSIEISKIGKGIKGQQLKAKLEDLFNPMRADGEKKYTLSIKLTQNKEAQLIRKIRDIDRYNIVLISEFTLKDKSTDKEIYNGKGKIISGYGVVDSDFATLSAEEDTIRRVTDEMAKEINFKIANYFISTNNK